MACLETTAFQTPASITGHALIGQLIMSVFAVKDISESTVMQSDELNSLHVLVVRVCLFVGEITKSDIFIPTTPTSTLQQGTYMHTRMHIQTHTCIYTDMN